MNELIVTNEIIEKFAVYLELEEKSKSTIEKYIRDVKAFQKFSSDTVVIKSLVILLLFSYTLCTNTI